VRCVLARTELHRLKPVPLFAERTPHCVRFTVLIVATYFCPRGYSPIMLPTRSSSIQLWKDYFGDKSLTNGCEIDLDLALLRWHRGKIRPQFLRWRNCLIADIGMKKGRSRFPSCAPKE